MNLVKRFVLCVVVLALFSISVVAHTKTSKSVKVIKSTTASVKPQGSCDQTCYQEFFDAIDNCNGLHYIDEGLYIDCVSQARQNLWLCQFFCRYGGILGKRQHSNNKMTQHNIYSIFNRQIIIIANRN